MGCNGCLGCSDNFNVLNIKERGLELSQKINEINNLIDKKENDEEILLKIIDVEKEIKKLRNQLLEKYIEKNVGMEVQQGNLEILEDLMLIIKKLG